MSKSTAVLHFQRLPTSLDINDVEYRVKTRCIGGTGYLGSHVVSQFLNAGHTVHATVRPGKEQKITNTYPNTNHLLKTFPVADLADGDFSAALKGVEAVVHVASPNYYDGSTPQEIIKGSIEGAVNIVQQAIKAGVKKIIATSSIITLFDPDFKRAFTTEPLTEDSWSSLTAEQADSQKDNGVFAYVAGKTLAEKKLWELASRHPEVDFTIIVPPAIYGPLVLHFLRPDKSRDLATIDFAYEIIKSSPSVWPDVPIGTFINVADAARAHVLAVFADPLPDGKQKRLLVSGGQYTWTEAADVLRAHRPELASRLPDSSLPAPAQRTAPMDTSLAEKVLGLKTYVPFKQTILETIDAALDWEKGIKSA